MNDINHIGCIRNNLCYILTDQKKNNEKIKNLNRIIENVELTRQIERPIDACLIFTELIIEVRFFEELNNYYNKEVSRLIKILLENPTEI